MIKEKNQWFKNSLFMLVVVLRHKNVHSKKIFIKDPEEDVLTIKTKRFLKNLSLYNIHRN